MRPGTYLDPKAAKSASRLEHRLAIASDPRASKCLVPGCGRPSQAKAGVGFDPYHCRNHVQFRNRHGSYWKGTYSADQLAPYRAAVRAHLLQERLDKGLGTALTGLQGLMWSMGRPVSVADARYLKPDKKAQAVLARMRQREVPAVRLLENHLAVTAAVREDPIGPGGEPDEYRLTQIGKACLRLASGYHSDPGNPHGHSIYPRSGGQMLRILGGLIDRECRPWAEEHLGAILQRKRQTEVDH